MKHMWGFSKLGVPYWGPYSKGILLEGFYIERSLIFVDPHVPLPFLFSLHSFMRDGANF